MKYYDQNYDDEYFEGDYYRSYHRSNPPMILVLFLLALFAFIAIQASGISAAVVAPPITTGQSVNVRVSNYWPPLGGINCGNFVNGFCVSKTAMGDPWEWWVGRGAACPPSWEFGTKFKLPDGSVWTCVDRGDLIQYVNGIPYVDLLTSNPHYLYGSVIKAEIIK